MKRPQMEVCSRCGGYTILYSGEDIVDCNECWGGLVEARDARGRYLPWVEAPAMIEPEQEEYGQAED